MRTATRPQAISTLNTFLSGDSVPTQSRFAARRYSARSLPSPGTIHHIDQPAGAATDGFRSHPRVAAVGSPQRYTSAAAYQKSFGLNLRENTSGTKKGGVAVMRKLTMALWHVAKGTEFDAALLFDTRRLKLTGGGAM